MENQNSVPLKISNVIKTFDGHDVIKKFNLTIEEGSIYGLLGPNGAGKTTLFKLITGLQQLTNGKIEVFNRNIATQKKEILQNIGIIIEVPIFIEHLSATENLSIHLKYMNCSDGDIVKVLEDVGLEPTNNQPVSNFSLGMRQRLAIARAIVHNPKLLILDEPINGLDPMGIREMRQLFLNLVQNKNMTIIISSHILSEIEHTADKIGIIVKGELKTEVTMKDVRDEHPEGLEELFLNIVTGGTLK
ncbi:ABC transporter ATP-binding protein [Bacillus pseudomycoides]|uniref:ABC transporter ATP-binding protein n=1 Tax=Bacillus pseudomycoides TaxID=64104 RepID=UPI000BEDF62D|nr:ATP-binding cassette domain-containing protein [Bacillus pseudomycoides]PEE44005.1 ABC transporter ATP-binding protein [Bacillus pseudomycoides]PEI86632.1 ABC transporter ATP-binding protein [Bacillus pseudomycoides]PGA82233.1 ABC transporter ATP-binding protein [Bacillus pseudomycoides]PHF43967.1 ABC transporter ATP-binding protein [Bacillus pseudomycoides]